MSRIFWLIVALIAAVVLVPPLRERAKPHLQPVLDPMYEWNARNRVKEIHQLVKRADVMGRQMPTRNDFAQFVEMEDMKENASIDPWGTPYYLVPSRTGFRVGSAGRDRQVGTADDILSNEERLNRPIEGGGRRRL
jgi:hypothetical protein